MRTHVVVPASLLVFIHAVSALNGKSGGSASSSGEAGQEKLQTGTLGLQSLVGNSDGKVAVEIAASANAWAAPWSPKFGGFVADLTPAGEANVYGHVQTSGQQDAVVQAGNDVPPPQPTSVVSATTRKLRQEVPAARQAAVPAPLPKAAASSVLQVDNARSSSALDKLTVSLEDHAGHALVHAVDKAVDKLAKLAMAAMPSKRSSLENETSASLQANRGAASNDTTSNVSRSSSATSSLSQVAEQTDVLLEELDHDPTKRGERPSLAQISGRRGVDGDSEALPTEPSNMTASDDDEEESEPHVRPGGPRRRRGVSTILRVYSFDKDIGAAKTGTWKPQFAVDRSHQAVHLNVPSGQVLDRQKALLRYESKESWLEFPKVAPRLTAPQLISYSVMFDFMIKGKAVDWNDNVIWQMAMPESNGLPFRTSNIGFQLTKENSLRWLGREEDLKKDIMGKWVHVGVTASNPCEPDISTLKVYVDGELKIDLPKGKAKDKFNICDQTPFVNFDCWDRGKKCSAQLDLLMDNMWSIEDYAAVHDVHGGLEKLYTDHEGGPEPEVTNATKSAAGRATLDPLTLAPLLAIASLLTIRKAA